MKLEYRLPLVVAAAALMAGGAMAESTLKVYFIGNSLTMSTTLDRVHDLFGQRGIDLQFGSQVSGGKSLIRHLNYTQEPDQKWKCWETCVPEGDTYAPRKNFYVVPESEYRFGRYDRALVEHAWDAVVMQLYLSTLHDDLIAIPAFMDLALKKNPATQFYIYSTWPRRPKAKGADGQPMETAANIEYAKLWEADFTATVDDTSKTAGNNYASRDYVNTLLEHLDKKYPNLEKPVRLIPAGEVIFALDRKIKEDQLPGLKELAARKPDLLPGLDADTTFADGANILYADAIHFNPIPHQTDALGIFMSGSTLFTVISAQNPVGLSGAGYGLDDEKDAELIKALQQTIWDVVQADPRTRR
jgi:hypothetical protein